MRHVFFLSLVFSLASCSVLLRDEEEIDKVVEDVIHEELKAGS